jgi:hypothetical protein
VLPERGHEAYARSFRREEIGEVLRRFSRRKAGSLSQP